MEAIAGNHPHLLLRSCKGIEVIALNTIVRVEGISNYSKLFFLDGKTMVVAKLLKWFEERLAQRQFVRIHKTHVINADFICGYVNGTGGKVALSNGEWISVSKRKKGIFIKFWMALSA